MRYLMFLVFLSFTALCVVIAVSNRQIVSFDLTPLPFQMDMPLFILIFAGMFTGLIAGWIVILFKGFKSTRERRLSEKRIKALEKELETRDKHILKNITPTAAIVDVPSKQQEKTA